MKKVLFIDDDPTLSKVVGSMLTAEGFHPILQLDAKNIDEIIQKNTPQIIILDYFLGEENGMDIALHLKRNDATTKIPVIMISSNYGLEPITKKIGIEAFLAKPFDIYKLVSLINKLTA